jgi:hypothetical protein
MRSPAGPSEASSDDSRVAKIAPNRATPIEAPIAREKVAVEVATPMCRRGALFCATRITTCITSPTPRPKISM